MRNTVAMLAVTMAAATAEAAVVTFDGLPDEGAQLTEWLEDGVRATAREGVLATDFRPGTAHLDDGGSGYAKFIAFTMERRFAAQSFDLLPVASSYVACPEDGGVGNCPVLSFANVLVEGYRDGARVASAAFDMFDAAPTYAFAPSFRGLDELVIGFALPVYEGPLPDGRTAICLDSPCTHYDIDNVTLAPVPLPASLGLLLAGLGGLGLVARLRR